MKQSLSSNLRGWVYVITNEAMPGIVKIGFTLKDPTIRSAELSNTGVPHAYELRYEALVECPRELEAAVHRRMENFKEGKEWFRVSPDQAAKEIKDEAGSRLLLENFYRIEVPEASSVGRPRVTPNDRAQEERAHGKRVFSATAAYSGRCQFCRADFTVTVTRYERGVRCLGCGRYNVIQLDKRMKLFPGGPALDG